MDKLQGSQAKRAQNENKAAFHASKGLSGEGDSLSEPIEEPLTEMQAALSGKRYTIFKVPIL